MTKDGMPGPNLPAILDVARVGGLQLKKVGKEYRATCVVTGHADSSPSLRINPEKGVYRCDPCVASGRSDGQGGVMKLATLLMVQLRDLPPAPPGAPPARTPRTVFDGESILAALVGADEEAEAYLRSRFLDPVALKAHVRFATTGCAMPKLRAVASLGFRLAAPLRDWEGEVVGVMLRNVRAVSDGRFHCMGRQKDAFYGNPKGLTKDLVIVEGLFDYLVATVAYSSSTTAVLGLPSAVSVSRDALHSVLAPLNGEVLIFPHNDQAGVAAMERVADACTDMRKPVRLVAPVRQFPKGDLADVWASAEGDEKRYHAAVGEFLRAADLWSPSAEPFLDDEDDEGAEPDGDTDDDEEAKAAEPSLSGKPVTVKGIPLRTVLVSRAILDAVLKEVEASAARRREGAGAPQRTRSASDALLALKIDTTLRDQSRRFRAFSRTAYLWKALGVTRQRLSTAARWLAAQGVIRKPGRRGEWTVSLPETHGEIGEVYIPVPEAGLRILTPSDFFVLALLHGIGEQINVLKIRRKVIPIRISIPRSLQAGLAITIGRGRYRAALRRLAAEHFVELLDSGSVLLTPNKAQQALEAVRGTKSSFALMRSPVGATAASFAALRGEEPTE
jgi:hypothetical protein